MATRVEAIGYIDTTGLSIYFSKPRLIDLVVHDLQLDKDDHEDREA